ncbi:TPA: DUF551 domain-containing protein [Serratia marcescens]|nr:phage protein [Serratia marcescens]BEN81762.1 phage protein [Serratia marcescens]HEP0388664.1 DUF551 domain-containing protein [Serratia marcescens]
MTLTTTEELKHLASSDNTNELTRRLARECLANREAQPVAIVEPSDYVTAAQLVGEEPRSKAVRPLFEGALAIGMELYTAPPAPAAPEKCPDRVRFLMNMHTDDLFGDADAQEIWNACRAAMLAQPVSSGYTFNSPEIPDGWIACSDRMPEEGDVVLVCQEGGIIYCAEMQDGELYPDEFPRVPSEGREITHWMPLPAAPEDGNG